MVWLVVQYDIMHGHDNLGDGWPPPTCAFYQCMAQCNVAIMSDSIIVGRGFQETTLRSHCSSNEMTSSSTESGAIPTSEEWSDISLHFYHTYFHWLLYTQNLSAFCSSCPALSKSIILRMTLTCLHQNDVMVYALEKIVSFAWHNQYTFMAQCTWWLASIAGLEEGLIIPMHNFQESTKVGTRMDWLWSNTTRDSTKDRLIPSTAKDFTKYRQAGQILDGAETSINDSEQTRY
jgi:hypothetical protein